MKYIFKNLMAFTIIILALPYLLTVLFDSKIPDNSVATMEVSVAHDKTTSSKIDVETYLIGILAQEIPISSEKEALKAQSVIARTNILYYLEHDIDLPKYKTPDDLNKLWGEELFWKNYQKLQEIILETKGEVIYYNDQLIDAPFHAVSAGKTRTSNDLFSNEDYPYFKQTNCKNDHLSTDYLKITTYSKKEFIQFCQDAYPDVSLNQDSLMEQIDLSNKDSAGYIKIVKLGKKEIDGEDFRKSFNLNSACFSIEECENSVRIVTKGLGHGAGLSQYTANSLAQKGKTYTDILNYFFDGITISQYSSKIE